VDSERSRFSGSSLITTKNNDLAIDVTAGTYRRTGGVERSCSTWLTVDDVDFD
jgi:hypothetical protein